MKKPEPENTKIYDLFECINYLETICPGIRNRLKDEISARLEVVNDSYIRIPFPEDDYNFWDYSEEITKDIILLKETFNIDPDNTLFRVWW